ncbi:hypothetical protein OF376_02540 [Ureaplasma miroungigenitalium]|uniref:ECF transporter S component n=1 Tax=Ureaplasma miroungigenitalium TaxID=1042321 RepID=A0ABT3BN33_9BACT|nr:hypothetical protein [Ureaplasma miroungigenitalium]MCV3728640.1 hypothetical protein [Ureaplasma miroungigenitalium]MCV3734331.1 hypothetical protein [Ureaplasma miroungigenitalium]
MKTNFGKNKKAKYITVNKSLFDFALSAIMLAVFLVINYLSSFLKFHFLVLDFACLALVVLVYKVRTPFVYIATIFGSMFNFFYSSASFIGVLIALFNNLVFISFVWIFARVVFKEKQHLKRYLLLTLVCSCLITTTISTVMNAILFTPLFWYIFKVSDTINFCQLIKTYQPTPYLLNAPTYLLGHIYLYVPFNLIKYAGIIILALMIAPLLINRHKTIKYTQTHNLHFRFNYDFKKTP